MPFPLQVNDVLLVQPVCQCASQISLNNYHYLVSSNGPPAATDADVVAQMGLLMGPLYQALMSANASYYGTMVRIVNRQPLPAFQANIVGAGIGTVAGAALPKQICGLVGKKTNVAGRIGRGRIYVPFPAAADDLGAGGPGGGYQTRMAALASAVLVPITINAAGRTAGLTPILWNKPLNRIITIIGQVVATRWATQRRRGDFGRPNIPPF